MSTTENTSTAIPEHRAPEIVRLPRDLAMLELRRLCAERENQLGAWMSDHTAEFYEVNRAFHIIRESILAMEGQ